MADYDRDDVIDDMDDGLDDDFDGRGKGKRGGRKSPKGQTGQVVGRSAYNSRRSNRSCPFLKKDGTCDVDYKDVDTLRRYITDEGKIRPRRQTNVCSKCQRALAIAVKRARHLALLPMAGQHAIKYSKD